MLKLKGTLAGINRTQSDLARFSNVSPATVSQIINHNKWPKSPDRADLIKSITNFLKQNCANDSAIETAFDEATGLVPAALSGSDEQMSMMEDEEMLLRKQKLTPEAKKVFGLFRDPFDELQSPDEMWISQRIREVRDAMYYTARHGGFVAVVGESGAGKSTLRRELAERVERGNELIMLIEPYVICAEDNDRKGKTFKSTNIAEALLGAVAPNERLKVSQQARFNQLHKALKDSYAAGYRHCLVIEEAHSLPIPTLKHLKRILELEVGMTKLVSVILIGQPELKDKLSVHSMEVREVVQRCQVVDLPPIEPHTLKDYLLFRYEKAAGKKVDDILDDTAVDALVQRLTLPSKKRDQRVSNLHPLAIGNLMTAAMNMAAELDINVIDKDLIMAV
ncbi:MAG: transposase [Oceanospirillaceae bacterium]|nr:transposase [Oceanospirillaceae bacterium]